MTATRLLALAGLGIVTGMAREPREEELEPSPRVELEFVASDIFRSGTTIVKLWRGLHLEGEYFGSPEFDVGVTGASWKLRWKGLSISPGLAVSFGSGVKKAPVVTFRWTLETRRCFDVGSRKTLPSKALGAETAVASC
jgi:hypothetical protein